MVYLYAHAEAKTQGDLNGTKIDICCADKVLPIPCPKVQRESIVYIIVSRPGSYKAKKAELDQFVCKRGIWSQIISQCIV